MQSAGVASPLPIGRYIVDFICMEQRLVIELDGGRHSEQHDEVLRDTEAVLEVIRQALSPNPSPASGRGE